MSQGGAYSRRPLCSKCWAAQMPATMPSGHDNRPPRGHEPERAYPRRGHLDLSVYTSLRGGNYGGSGMHRNLYLVLRVYQLDRSAGSGVRVARCPTYSPTCPPSPRGLHGACVRRVTGTGQALSVHRPEPRLRYQVGCRTPAPATLYARLRCLTRLDKREPTSPLFVYSTSSVTGPPYLACRGFLHRFHDGEHHS